MHITKRNSRQIKKMIGFKEGTKKQYYQNIILSSFRTYIKGNFNKLFCIVTITAIDIKSSIDSSVYLNYVFLGNCSLWHETCMAFHYDQTKIQEDMEALTLIDSNCYCVVCLFVCLVIFCCIFVFLVLFVSFPYFGPPKYM